MTGNSEASYCYCCYCCLYYAATGATAVVAGAAAMMLAAVTFLRQRTLVLEAENIHLKPHLVVGEVQRSFNRSLNEGLLTIPADCLCHAITMASVCISFYHLHPGSLLGVMQGIGCKDICTRSALGPQQHSWKFA